MKVLLGTKEGMSQIFDNEGRVHPVTVVAVPQNVITQVKTEESDSYTAVQIGAGSRKEKNISKPVLGHLKGLGPFKWLREFRIDAGEMKVGDTIDVSVFEEGDKVRVSALSKGKGFQGTVKRYNFKGGPRTHGNKHHERAPGSIGAKGPAKVWKGQKMPGHMGHERVTVKGLRVVAVDAEAGKLFIRGAIPGPRGGMVEVQG